MRGSTSRGTAEANGDIPPVAPIKVADVGISVEAPASVSRFEGQGPMVTLGTSISNWATILEAFKSILFPVKIEKYVKR